MGNYDELQGHDPAAEEKIDFGKKGPKPPGDQAGLPQPEPTEITVDKPSK